MTIKALTFDVFGTVVDWRGSLIQELTPWFASRAPGVDVVSLVDDWRGAYVPSMDRVRRGELPWTGLDTLHRQSLEQLLAAAGAPAFGEEDLVWLTRAWWRLTPWSDSVPGLQRLKKKFTISPLSNGSVALLTALAKRAGLPWDLILCSELFRHYKRDPEVYLGAAALLQLDPAEIMMVAAHNDDLLAAQKLGFATAFIGRPTEYGPRQTKDFGPEGSYTHVAADLVDLAHRLGC
ncbi:MAG: haloacid dehalogenase type II [Alphaproteobacteria bacterium]|nr:haloacid dehalogenase type II [Alphaproteobacteria bacterium]TAD91509.1 MAG: haloacid dehalogenase type II [Alphaproteobacteria bacterium]